MMKLRDTKKILVQWGLIATVYGLALLSLLLLKRTIPFEIKSLLNESHPIRIQYESYLTRFNDEKSGWLAIDRKTPFSAKEIESLSFQILRFLELDTRLESPIGPTNAKFIYIHPDTQQVEIVPFLQNGQWSAGAETALKTELWRGNLFKDDFSGFIFTFKFPRDLPRRTEALEINKLEKFLMGLQKVQPDIEFSLLGAKIASYHFLKEMQFQQRVITPILLLAIMAFLFFVFRSWQIVGWSLLIMFICYASTLCLIIALEGGLGPYSSFSLMFSVIVATSDLIQFFGRFQHLKGTVRERLRETVRIAWVPCLLTSLTTAAGFFALVINQNLPIRHFGIYCAFSCLIEWVLIFYALPPILNAFGFNPRQYRLPTAAFHQNLQNFIHRYRRSICVFSALFIFTALYFSQTLWIDDNFYTKFERSHPLSQSVERFASNYDFVGSIDLLVKSKQPLKGQFDPQWVQTMNLLEKEILNIPMVSKLSSFRQIHDTISDQLPRSKDPASKDQSLSAILELFNNYGAFNSFYNNVENEFRISVFLKSMASADLENVLKEIQRIAPKFADQMTLTPNGFSVVRSFINGRVIHDFFESFLLSFFLILLCYLWLFKSIKWALLALVPNLIPLIAISGLMGLLKTPVDSNLIILICVAFGIAGDNTIHLSYSIIQFQKLGLSYRDSLDLSFKLLGNALISTSAIFILCLPVFLLGDLKLFDHIAIDLSFAFIMAFISDVVIFPALQLQWNWLKPPLNFEKQESLSNLENDLSLDQKWELSPKPKVFEAQQESFSNDRGQP